MKIKREFVIREIAGDTILIPVGTTALEMNGMAVLNEVGARLWELLPDAANAEALVTVILEEYEVDEDTAREDVAEFLRKLTEYGIV